MPYTPAMQRAAFFDLDGTLLAVNSVVLWVRRERALGRISRTQALRAAAFFVGYRLSILDIDEAVRAALQTVAGTEESVMRDAIQAWYRADIAPRAAPGAFPVVEAHRAAGDLLVLLTSSSVYVADEARAQFGLDVSLCTRYEVRDGRFTGEAVRPLCFGDGKVKLAEMLAAERNIDLSSSAFYTDSLTDLPMLLRVGQPYAVNPDPRLRWEARRRGWPRLDWTRPATQPPAASTEQRGDSP